MSQQIQKLIAEGKMLPPLLTLPGIDQTPFKSAKFYYVEVDSNITSFSNQSIDFMDRLKTILKMRLGTYYCLCVAIFSPTMPRIIWRSGKTYFIDTIKKLSRSGDLIIQLGSGNYRIQEGTINVDLRDFPEVDVVADCTNLPFASDCVDIVVSSALIEHVEHHDVMLQEVYRVLKPGGYVITGAPFIQGSHGSPDDYYRWTKNGLRAVHEAHNFRVVNISLLGGATSGLLWVLQEWLALFFSFGSTILYRILFIFFTLLLFPLKLLDIVMILHPEAHKIASFMLCVAQKPMVETQVNQVPQ